MPARPTLSFFLSPLLPSRTIRSARRQGVFPFTWGEVLYVTYAHSRSTWGWKLDNPLLDAQLREALFRNWFPRHRSGIRIKFVRTFRGRWIADGLSFNPIAGAIPSYRFPASFYLIFWSAWSSDWIILAGKKRISNLFISLAISNLFRQPRFRLCFVDSINSVNPWISVFYTIPVSPRICFVSAANYDGSKISLAPLKVTRQMAWYFSVSAIPGISLLLPVKTVQRCTGFLLWSVM